MVFHSPLSFYPESGTRNTFSMQSARELLGVGTKCYVGLPAYSCGYRHYCPIRFDQSIAANRPSCFRIIKPTVMSRRLHRKDVELSLVISSVHTYIIQLIGSAIKSLFPTLRRYCWNTTLSANACRAALSAFCSEASTSGSRPTSWATLEISSSLVTV